MNLFNCSQNICNYNQIFYYGWYFSVAQQLESVIGAYEHIKCQFKCKILLKAPHAKYSHEKSIFFL